MKSNLTKDMMSDMKREIIYDLQRELDEEISKSTGEWDCQKISELTKTINDISCEDTASGDQYEKSKIELIEKLKATEKSKQKIILKRVTAAVACLLVCLGLNFVSISAFGTNMFSAAYRLLNGGISIDMNERIELPTTADDPYGMKTKCAEYGMYPETPSYIPEGFRLVHVDDVKKTDSIRLTFYYKKEGIKLHFVFFQYYNKDQIPPVGIPTDTYNVVEEEINNHKMYIMKEDNQFTANFQSDNIVYSIASDGLNYDECHKIAKSMAK